MKVTQQSCDVVEIAGESFDLAEADDGWVEFDADAQMERYRRAYDAWMLRPRPEDDGWLRSEEGFAAARRQHRAYARFFGSRRREAEETS